MKGSILMKFHIDYRSSELQQKELLEHNHDTYELDFFIHADLTVFIKDRKYRIANGDMLFIHAFDLHRVLYPAYQTYTRYVINFNQAYIENLLKPYNLIPMFEEILQRAHKKVSLDLNQRGRVEEICKLIVRLYDQLTDSPSLGGIKKNTIEFRLKMSFLQLLIEFYELGISAPPPYKGNRTEQIVEDILRYLDTHYAEAIQLQNLEESLGLSKYHLSHLFRDATSLTIMDYLQYRRIMEAQRKLIQTNQSLLDISMDCGFPSLPYFYRVFKKISHTTPSRYRKLHQWPANQ